MLAGEHVISVSTPGTLFLVPIASGAAKPLPQSIRNSPSDVPGAQSYAIPHHVDVHSLASPRPTIAGGAVNAVSATSGTQNLSASSSKAASAATAVNPFPTTADVDAFFSNESTRRRSVIPVQCVCSNYRLVLTPLVSGGFGEMKRVELPFMLIDWFEMDLRARDSVWAITMFTKWTWVYRLQSSEEAPLQQLAQMLQTRFPTTQSQFFAFEHFDALQQRISRLDLNPTTAEGGDSEVSTLPSESAVASDVPLSMQETNGTHDSAWGLINLRRELHRQTVVDGTVYAPSYTSSTTSSGSPAAPDEVGVTTPVTHPDSFGCGINLAPWFHVVALTSQRDAFRTYPLEIVVPRRVSHDLLERCASYRQNGRIPSVSWVHGINGATLSRSSQPKAGAPGFKEDQTLCSYLNQSYHVTNTVCAPPSSSNTAVISAATAAAAAAAAVTPSTPVALASTSASPPLSSSPSTSLVPPPSIIGDSFPAPLGGAAQQPSRAPPPSLFEEPHNVGTAATSLGTAKYPSGSDSETEPDRSRGRSGGGGAAIAAGRTAEPTRPLANKSEERPLHIMDFRTKAAAAANMATGGGFELVWNYARASIEFMNLDNIHAVRDSFDRLRKLCVEMQLPMTDCPVVQSAHGSFYARLHDSGWVLMLQRLIWASWKAATLVHQGVSVLGHCTDGWDRTAQVIALAKLQLDAHYRTLEGFCELIAWEWLEMGHKFGDRCATQRPLDVSGNDGGAGTFVFVGSDGEEDTSDDAAAECTTVSEGPRKEEVSASHSPQPQRRRHSSSSTSRNHSSSPSSQISPVFLQFLDAVYQLWNMFPQSFEFTPALLSLLAESAYSCRFGTFLQNCQRARLRGGNGIATHTASVWGEIERRVAVERTNASQVPPDERLLNPFFRPVMSRCPRGTPAAQVAHAFYQQRIIPSFQAFRYRFWASLYCRHHWEGTGTAMDHDSFSPLYDAMLVLAQRANVRQLSDVDGWNDCTAEDVEEAQQESGAVPGRTTTAAGCLALRRSRVLFRHRLPVVAVAAEWQIVGPSAQGPHDVAKGRSSAQFFLARSNARACELCRAEFTMFFRRHTCRMCCRAACSTCSSHFVVLPSESIALYEERDAKRPLRVCFQCYEGLNKGPLRK